MKKLIRFELLFAIIAIAAALIVSTVHAPYVDRLIRNGKGLYGFWALEKRSAEVKERKAVLHRENRLLDSLIAVYQHRMQGDETSAAAMVYNRADLTGVKTSKVSIGEVVKVKGHEETSVTVRGRGSYAAIGRFCEEVENLPAPVRVKQITLESIGNGIIDAVIDFALLSQGTAMSSRRSAGSKSEKTE